MIAHLFDIQETANRGKGLFARGLVPAGTIVWFACEHCRILTASEIGFDSLSAEERKRVLDYAYRREDGTFLAPCDEARYLNHSCNANILGTDLGFDIVVRDIAQGQEATYDYRDFYDEIAMACSCGEPNCCKLVTFEHPTPKPLKAFWASKIEAALKRIDRVDQPLKEPLQQRSLYPLAGPSSP